MATVFDAEMAVERNHACKRLVAGDTAERLKAPVQLLVTVVVMLTSELTAAMRSRRRRRCPSLAVAAADWFGRRSKLACGRERPRTTGGESVALSRTGAGGSS